MSVFPVSRANEATTEVVKKVGSLTLIEEENQNYLLADKVYSFVAIRGFEPKPWVGPRPWVEQCAFCRRNGSPFINHPLKDSEGGTVCPVLSRFTCKMCAATGREAHTHKYCKNNPYTRGNPRLVGMAPGPSRRNPRKSPVKVDPNIDLNDIYGIRKYGGSVGSQQLAFDATTRLLRGSISGIAN